jgi:hypothetical protein
MSEDRHACGRFPRGHEICRHLSRIVQAGRDAATGTADLS